MVIAFGHKSAAADCAIGLLPDLQSASVSKVVAVLKNGVIKGDYRWHSAAKKLRTST